MCLSNIFENIKLRHKVFRLENKVAEQEKLIQSLKDIIEYIYKEKEYFRGLVDTQDKR